MVGDGRLGGGEAALPADHRLDGAWQREAVQVGIARWPDGLTAPETE